MRIHEDCLREVEKVVNHRTHSKDYQLGLNLVDIIIEYNKKVMEGGHPEKALNSKEILDNVMMFVFASVGTTSESTKTCLYILGQYQEHQKNLREEVRKDIFTDEDLFDNYVESEYLEDFLTESFRVFTPALANFYARTYKNYKLGDVKVYKGTGMMVSLYTIQKKPEIFKNPMEFDLKKYEDKKKTKQMKKSLLVPFGGGNRNCIGQNLARMTIKIFVANLVNMFEIKPSSKPNPRVGGFALGVSHSLAKLRVFQ